MWWLAWNKGAVCAARGPRPTQCPLPEGGGRGVPTQLIWTFSLRFIRTAFCSPS